MKKKDSSPDSKPGEHKKIEPRPIILNVKFGTINRPPTEAEVTEFRKKMITEAEGGFPWLVKDYENEYKTSTFYLREIDLVDVKIKLITDYIEETKNWRVDFVKKNNGLSHGLKRPKDFFYLPSYEKFLSWLNQRKNELENSSPESPSFKSRPVLQTDTIEQQKNIAKDYLKFLSGINIHGHKIMETEQFEKLIDYTNYLIENDQLPNPIKPFSKINISNEFLRYTFYLIHRELYGTRPIKDVFIDFLHDVFSQFKNTAKSTTKTKFSIEPTHYSTDSKLIEK